MARTPKPNRQPGYRPRVAGRPTRPQTSNQAQTNEAQTNEAQTNEAQTSAAQSPGEPHAPEVQTPETQTREPQAREPQTRETQAPEVDVTDTVERTEVTDGSGTETEVASETVTESATDSWQPVDEDSGAANSVTDDAVVADASGPTVDEPVADADEPPAAESGDSGTTVDSAAANDSDADSDVSDADAETAVDLDKARPTGKARPVSRVSTLRPKADQDSSTGPATAGTKAGQKKSEKKRNRPARRRALLSVPAIAALWIVAAVLGLFALIAALHPGANLSANKAFVEQSATTELVAQAQTKVCNANSARSDGFEEWVNGVRSSMTGEALDWFNQAVPTFRDQFSQRKTANDCKIDAIGVNNLTGTGEGAKASVLVSMVVSGTVDGVPTQSVTPRYQVSMVKRGDQWLIANLSDI
ncbi:hypothetical protein GCM10009624_01750 [Gordonia sinesedis]